MFTRTQSLKETLFGKFRKTKDDPQQEFQKLDNEDDKIFMNEMTIIIKEFAKTKEPSLNLKPMNSYHRHLVHQLVQDLKLFSQSEGVRDDRHLVIYRTQVKNNNQGSNSRGDRGDRDDRSNKRPMRSRQYSKRTSGDVNGNRATGDVNGNRIEASDNTSEETSNRAQRPARPPRAPRAESAETRDQGSKNSRPRRDSSDRNSRGAAPSAKEYLVPVSEAGLEIILDKEGYVGIRKNQTDADIVDKKLITTGGFAVRGNKIFEL